MSKDTYKNIDFILSPANREKETIDIFLLRKTIDIK